MEVNEDQQITFALFSSHFRWKKVDSVEGTWPLYGGFTFHLGESMVLWPSNKWKKGYEDFLQYAKEDEEQKDLLSKLTWFESPTPVAGPIYTPYYGCVLVEEGHFPDKFYFFDGGIIYPLPFKSYEEYITTLLGNAGVECWQYFYVDPELLVKRNKGLNYMTTDLRFRTHLVEKIAPFVYEPSYTFDRLDLIVEYLKRCAKHLPPAFPAIDFGHQEKYLEELEKLL